MILAGLRSEEMEKEKNTRENKSQCNVNTKDIAELSLTQKETRKPLVKACEPVKTVAHVVDHRNNVMLSL